MKNDILANIESDNSIKLNIDQLLEYTDDLKAILAEGTIIEQKTILKSFVKRIDYEPKQVTISYTTPLPTGKGTNALEEVLSMESCGEPPEARTLNLLIKRYKSIIPERKEK